MVLIPEWFYLIGWRGDWQRPAEEYTPISTPIPPRVDRLIDK